MANKKDIYVVGILETYEDRTEVKYVTNVENKPKVAEWKAGELAMEFSKEYAKDVAFGLCVNGYAAIPMLKADYLELRNCLATKQESEDKKNV